MTITPIVQFGTSRFLQAHADLFVNEAIINGENAGPITVVAGSGAAQGRARLTALSAPDGYPVIIRGLRLGERVELKTQVNSIRRSLEADANWADLIDVFVDQAEFVISNTTEAGYAVSEGLELDLSRDLQAPPPGFPARLLVLLATRWRAGRSGLIILPTELVGRNGDTLRGIVLDIAKRNGADDELICWIRDDCVFANSLVDRIVSQAIEPAGAIAEPYALWAVEDTPGLRLPCRHPSIQVVPDLEPVERLKIHILNLGHTVLAERWLTRGADPGVTVRHMLEDRDAAEELAGVYDNEVLPGFSGKGMGDAAVCYRETTMERFRNPFLDHRLADIASGHRTKVARRLRGFIDWVAGATQLPMPHLTTIAQKYETT